eukprot:1898717-Rhodomonas_salina.1
MPRMVKGKKRGIMMFRGGRARIWSKGRGQQGFNLTISGSAEEVAIPEKLFLKTFWFHQIPQIRVPGYPGAQSVYRVPDTGTI